MSRGILFFNFHWVPNILFIIMTIIGEIVFVNSFSVTTAKKDNGQEKRGISFYCVMKDHAQLFIDPAFDKRDVLHAIISFLLLCGDDFI